MKDVMIRVIVKCMSGGSSMELSVLFFDPMGQIRLEKSGDSENQAPGLMILSSNMTF